MVPKFLADKAFTFTGPGTPPTSGIDATLKLEKIVSQVIGLLTLVAVIYFAIQIILAGFGYISSEGDKGKAETARKRITDGILGLFIVVIAIGFGSLLAKLLGLQNPFDINAALNSMGL
jgi:hypothetical protein